MTNRKVFVGGIIISLLAIVYLLSYPKPVATVQQQQQQRPVVVYEAMKRPAPVRRPLRSFRLPDPKPVTPPVPMPAHVMLTQTSEARPFPDEAPPFVEPSPPRFVEPSPPPFVEPSPPPFVEPSPPPFVEPSPRVAASSLTPAYTPTVLPRRARALPMSRKSFRSMQPQSFTPPPPPPPPPEANRRPVTLIKDL